MRQNKGLAGCEIRHKLPSSTFRETKFIEMQSYQSVTGSNQIEFENILKNFRGHWNFGTNVASIPSERRVSLKTMSAQLEFCDWSAVCN
jgi:hypothetical protein